jgi:hypothetical protein
LTPRFESLSGDKKSKHGTHTDEDIPSDLKTPDHVSNQAYSASANADARTYGARTRSFVNTTPNPSDSSDSGATQYSGQGIALQPAKPSANHQASYVTASETQMPKNNISSEQNQITKNDTSHESEITISINPSVGVNSNPGCKQTQARTTNDISSVVDSGKNGFEKLAYKELPERIESTLTSRPDLNPPNTIVDSVTEMETKLGYPQSQNRTNKTSIPQHITEEKNIKESYVDQGQTKTAQPTSNTKKQNANVNGDRDQSQNKKEEDNKGEVVPSLKTFAYTLESTVTAAIDGPVVSEDAQARITSTNSVSVDGEPAEDTVSTSPSRQKVYQPEPASKQILKETERTTRIRDEAYSHSSRRHRAHDEPLSQLSKHSHDDHHNASMLNNVGDSNGHGSQYIQRKYPSGSLIHSCAKPTTDGLDCNLPLLQDSVVKDNSPLIGNKNNLTAPTGERLSSNTTSNHRLFDPARIDVPEPDVPHSVELQGARSTHNKETPNSAVMQFQKETVAVKTNRTNFVEQAKSGIFVDNTIDDSSNPIPAILTRAMGGQSKVFAHTQKNAVSEEGKTPTTIPDTNEAIERLNKNQQHMSATKVPTTANQQSLKQSSQNNRFVASKVQGNYSSTSNAKPATNGGEITIQHNTRIKPLGEIPPSTHMNDHLPDAPRDYSRSNGALKNARNPQPSISSTPTEVHIGQVDVIIQTPEPMVSQGSISKMQRESELEDMVSRCYLRRL